jgi:hypothetical protein
VRRHLDPRLASPHARLSRRKSRPRRHRASRRLRTRPPFKFMAFPQRSRRPPWKRTRDTNCHIGRLPSSRDALHGMVKQNPSSRRLLRRHASLRRSLQGMLQRHQKRSQIPSPKMAQCKIPLISSNLRNVSSHSPPPVPSPADQVASLCSLPQSSTQNPKSTPSN